jgi:hypothetical protein
VERATFENSTGKLIDANGVDGKYTGGLVATATDMAQNTSAGTNTAAIDASATVHLHIETRPLSKWKKAIRSVTMFFSRTGRVNESDEAEDDSGYRVQDFEEGLDPGCFGLFTMRRG